MTQYVDAIAILKDPRFTKDKQKLSHLEGEQTSPAERAAVLNRLLTFRRDMLVVDPPDHTRLRGLVSKAFTHPEQMRSLRADLSLIPSAIEELLRYTAPVIMSSPRWASEDVPLHDKMIREGEMVFVSLSAADTDPRQFTDPEVLDITRQENQHIAFGKGIHYCLGAPLARLEGQIAISTLLQRLPHLRLASNPEQLTWTLSPILRGLTGLEVAF